ncbi:MAG: aldehyde dehydrogenase [Actinobacteria bacterium]|nr:aldehyde dehydrogenase [Actinomycetota bacterium]
MTSTSTPNISLAPYRHVGGPDTAPTGELESFNPSTGELVGSVPTIKPEQVDAVVAEIGQVQPFWAELSFSDRARYLRRAAQVMTDRKDEIAALLTAEQGKVRTEAYAMEVMTSIDSFIWAAGNAAKFISDEKIKPAQPFMKTRKMHFRYAPIGVIGVISPWNYPLLLPAAEIATALMAGNGIIFKPASLTCLIGQKLQEVFDEAGLPEGLMRTVHGGGAVGQAIVDSKDVGKIFFTGSVEVGRHIAECCAKQIKGCTLELGGKDPMLVLSDANMAHAIDGAAWGGFANMGQTCSGIERVYVMHDVADRFINGVVERAKSMKIGDPNQWSTEIGAMTSADQYELVNELVEDAVSRGATMLCGGPIPKDQLPPERRDGTYYGPTVLTGVNHGMRIMQEEIFGPVLPIITVDNEDEAIRLANDSEFGLGASIWSADREKALAMADRVEAGNVWINDHMYSAGICQCSWGGMKDSGLGRAHSKFGFYEAVEIQVQAVTPVREASMWLHPYDETVGPGIRASIDLLYAQGGDKFRTLGESSGALIRMGIRSAQQYFRK